MARLGDRPLARASPAGTCPELHDWVDVDGPRAPAVLAEAGLAEDDAPVVLFGSGRFLRNPGYAELADCSMGSCQRS